MTSEQSIHALPERSATDPRFHWNSESVFATPAAWQAEYDAISAGLPGLAKFQGQLGQGAAQLAAALEARDALLRRLGLLVMYALMQQEVDKTNQEYNAAAAKAQGLQAQALAALAFIEPEILALGDGDPAAYLKRQMASEPRLAVYAHYFDDLLRKQAHVRSGEVEELLGMLAGPFTGVSTVNGILIDSEITYAPASDSQGASHEVSSSGLTAFIHHPDRTLRRNAWNNLFDGYLMFKNTLTGLLQTSIQQNVVQMRARRHATTLEASLFENNIPLEVFHNLIDTFRKNLPTWHRYWEVRRRALGLERLEPFDIWAPLSTSQPEVSFEQAVEWISSGLKPLGEDYAADIRRGCLEQRWVDIYPNKGKTSGAFSYGSPGSHPFIVMSYLKNIFSLSTLTHELGHSMHSLSSWRKQPFVYSGHSLFIAEVASNFHQAMTRAHLLETNSDPLFQVNLIEEAMANFYRYFLVMPTIARFELDIHQRVERGEGLSADDLIELMADLFMEAYGPAFETDRTRLGMSWVLYPHLYADYYVYQYATGISAAHALASRVLKGGPAAARDYRNFLDAGSSVYPLEALKIAGVDMTSPQPVEETFQVLAGYVDRLEKLLL